MEQSTNTYAYEELNNESREIRLFEIISGDRSEPIKGKLSRCSLNDHPLYEALSYTWGDVESTLPIQLDNVVDFQVTVNLERALRDLRPRSGEPNRIIWIDAICINQEDIPERNYQVIFMRQIYQHASVVLVWLDLDIDITSPVFVKLATLSQYSSKDELGDDPRFWSPLEAIRKQPYWGRVWIQQELYFASKFLIHCRHNALTPESLIILDKLVDEYRDFGDHLAWWDAGRYGAPIEKYLDDKPRDDGVERFQFDNILHAMWEFSCLKATNERDKTFAALSLIKGYRPGDIDVDYNLSLSKVRLDIVRLMLEKHTSLAFLAFVSPEGYRDGDVPSWVPDWKDSHPSNSSLLRLISQLRGWDSLLVSRWRCKTLPTILSNNTDLIVCGYKLDEILQIFENPEIDRVGTSEEIGLKELEAWDRMLMLLRKLYRKDRNGREKLRRAILGKWSREYQQEKKQALKDCMALAEVLMQRGDQFNSEVSRFGRGLAAFFVERKEDGLDHLGPEFLSQTSLLYHVSTRTQNYFVSGGRRLGLVPPGTNPHDEIWMLFQCPLPLVLRKQTESYTVQGPAYVSGLGGFDALVHNPIKVYPDCEPGKRYLGGIVVEKIKLR